MAAKKGARKVEKVAQEGRALVIVSPELHKRLKVYAAERETNVRAVVDEAIQEFLKKEGGSQKK